MRNKQYKYFLQTICPCAHFGSCAVYDQIPGFSKSKENGYPFYCLGSVRDKNYVPLYRVLQVNKEYVTEENVIQAVTGMHAACKKCHDEHTNEGEHHSRICISHTGLPENILSLLIERGLVTRIYQ